MKHLKIYEGYIEEQLNNIKNKLNKLKKIIDFIEKYDFDYLTLTAESTNSDYVFETISKKQGDYYLSYDDYTEPNNGQIKNESLLNLSDKTLDELVKTCDDSILSIDRLLEIGLVDIQQYISIFKKHKEPIDFSQWMFSILIENDLQDEVNTFKFQDVLFSNHPEAFSLFMKECEESQEKSKGRNWDPLKIASGIKEKYKKLFDKYQMEKDSEKYNL